MNGDVNFDSPNMLDELSEAGTAEAATSCVVGCSTWWLVFVGISSSSKVPSSHSSGAIPDDSWVIGSSESGATMSTV